MLSHYLPLYLPARHFTKIWLIDNKFPLDLMLHLCYHAKRNQSEGGRYETWWNRIEACLLTWMTWFLVIRSKLSATGNYATDCKNHTFGVGFLFSKVLSNRNKLPLKASLRMLVCHKSQITSCINYIPCSLRPCYALESVREPFLLLPWKPTATYAKEKCPRRVSTSKIAIFQTIHTDAGWY